MNFVKSVFKSVFSGESPNLSAELVKEQLESDQPPYIIDVRQATEYRSGHIVKSKLVPLHELSTHMKNLPKDRDILCVCHSGARSSVARRQLAQAGFTAYNLRGGMTAWQRAGYPVKRGK